MRNWNRQMKTGALVVGLCAIVALSLAPACANAERSPLQA